MFESCRHIFIFILVMLLASSCNSAVDSGEWQHSPEIPVFLTTELPEDNSEQIPEIVWDYVKLDRESLTDITFSNEFFVSAGVATSDSIMLAGAYCRPNDRMSLLPPLTGSLIYGHPSYLLWMDDNLEVQKQLELPDRYYNVSHMLFDANHDQVYMLCSEVRKKGSLSLLVVAMDTDGKVLWEMPVPYYVSDFVLVEGKNGPCIAVAVWNMPKSIYKQDKSYWGESMRAMKDIYGPDGSIYASAIYVFDYMGELRESYFEKEGVYQKIIGDSNLFLCGMAWYDGIAWQEMDSEQKAEKPNVGYRMVSRETGEMTDRQIAGDYTSITAVAMTDDLFYIAFRESEESKEQTDICIFDTNEELQKIVKGASVRFYQSSKWNNKIIAYNFDSENMQNSEGDQFGYMIGMEQYVTAYFSNMRSGTTFYMSSSPIFIDIFDSPACILNMSSIRKFQSNLLCLSIQEQQKVTP